MEIKIQENEILKYCDFLLVPLLQYSIFKLPATYYD